MKEGKDVNHLVMKEELISIGITILHGALMNKARQILHVLMTIEGRALFQKVQQSK